MAEFCVHSDVSAPAESQALLEKASDIFGFVPNLLAVMAESPQVLAAYLQLTELFMQTSFTDTEKNILLLTVSYFNNCEYCMAAHSVIATLTGVDSDIVTALREGAPLADKKLQALREFTVLILEKRGFVDNAAIDNFIAQGYQHRHILEINLAISMKTLSNYTNHIAKTPVDDILQAAAWQKA